MSGVYKYKFTFPTTFPRHKRTYIGWYDKLQNLFPINGNSFQRKPKLIATPYILY